MPTIDLRGKGTGSSGGGGADKDAREEARRQMQQQRMVLNASKGLDDIKMKKARQEQAAATKLARDQAAAQKKQADTASKLARDTAAAQRKAMSEDKKARDRAAKEQAAALKKESAERIRAERQAAREQQARMFGGYSEAARENSMRDRQAREERRALFTGYDAAHRDNIFGAKDNYAGVRADNRAVAYSRAGFMGRVGHNAQDILGESFTAGAITGVLKKFALVMAAAIEAPFLPGQLQRGALALAEPASNLQKSTLAYGRAGGFDGAGLYRGVFPGTGTTKGTEWMNSLMLTPEKVMGSLGAFGIQLGGASQAQSVAKMFARQSMMPGFTGMPEGTVEGLSRQTAGYKLQSGLSLNSYINSISAMMEDSVAKGLDRAKVLDNIQSAMDTVAKGAAGVSSRGVLDMFARMQASGTPTGRTGEAAVSMLSAMQNLSTGRDVNPGAQFMMYSQLGKYDMLKSEKGIRGFIGEENWKNTAPRVRDLAVKDILNNAQTGNTFAAFNIARQTLMGANPNRIGELLQTGVNAAYPDRLRSSAMASYLGVPLGDAYAYKAGAGARSGSMPKSLGTGYDKGQEDYYRQTLVNAYGFSPDTVTTMLQEGRAANMSPLALLAKRQLEAQGMGTSDYDIQSQMQNNIIKGSTPPGLGKAENQGAQATLAGAETALTAFVPAVTRATEEMEKFGNALSEATGRTLRSRGYNDLPGSPAFRRELGQPGAGNAYTAPAPAMNPAHQ